MKNIGISLADPLAPDLAGTPCNNDTPEDLVVCIVSASAGETFLKNYRSDVRYVLRRIKGRSSRIDFIHYRSRPVGILDRSSGMGLFSHALALAMARLAPLKASRSRAHCAKPGLPHQGRSRASRVEIDPSLGLLL